MRRNVTFASHRDRVGRSGGEGLERRDVRCDTTSTRVQRSSSFGLVEAAGQRARAPSDERHGAPAAATPASELAACGSDHRTSIIFW
jgi:hypothetical protein